MWRKRIICQPKKIFRKSTPPLSRNAQEKCRKPGFFGQGCVFCPRLHFSTKIGHFAWLASSFFWAPTKETQPRSTKRNPNFGRTRHTLAVPWVLRRRNAGAARGGSTRKDASGLSPRAAGHGAIFGPFLAVFRPFFPFSPFFTGRSGPCVACVTP